MLVFTRKVHESFRIGDSIIVTITEVRHDHRVKIAVDAPRQVPIHREEVYQSIQQEKQDADDEGEGD